MNIKAEGGNRKVTEAKFPFSCSELKMCEAKLVRQLPLGAPTSLALVHLNMHSALMLGFPSLNLLCLQSLPVFFMFFTFSLPSVPPLILVN